MTKRHPVTPALLEQMRADMELVFHLYDLSPAARKTAADSAMRRALAASRCYRAIVASL